jgi:hypothetical protein
MKNKNNKIFMGIKDRRGFLLGEETLKIIISVIAMIFLIYLLASLYYNSSKNKDLNLAKESVEYIVKEAKIGSEEIQIYNPEKWFILNHPEESGFLCICKTLVSCDVEDNCIDSEIIVNWHIKIDEIPLILELNENVLTKKQN